MITFVIGILVGAVIMALMVASSKDDNHRL